jgi:hypothetical protein
VEKTHYESAMILDNMSHRINKRVEKDPYSVSKIDSLILATQSELETRCSEFEYILIAVYSVPLLS